MNKWVILDTAKVFLTLILWHPFLLNFQKLVLNDILRLCSNVSGINELSKTWQTGIMGLSDPLSSFTDVGLVIAKFVTSLIQNPSCVVWLSPFSSSDLFLNALSCHLLIAEVSWYLQIYHVAKWQPLYNVIDYRPALCNWITKSIFTI